MAHKETSNIWLTGVLGLLLTVACATSPKQDYGPSSEPEPPPGGSVGPAPQAKRSVVVVMAGTGARAFAAAGVLKEIVAKKIEVGGLVGTGLGGTLAVLFAKSKSINEFEWMLTRLRDNMLDGSPEGRQALREYLQKTLGEADLADLRRPVTLLVGGRSEPRAIERGRAHLWAEASLLAEDASPELKIDGEKVFRNTSRAYPVAAAKQLSRGPVIAIDLRSDSNEGGEIQDADLVVRPDLSGVTEQDFARRSSVTFRGAKAMREQGELLEQKLRE